MSSGENGDCRRFVGCSVISEASSRGFMKVDDGDDALYSRCITARIPCISESNKQVSWSLAEREEKTPENRLLGGHAVSM